MTSHIDADLKTLALSDRAAAFDALVRQTRPRLVRHARSIVHDPDLASDIVQDVLIKAMREPRLFDADFRPAAWLYRVTTNLCLNTVRDNRRRGDILAGMVQKPEAEANQIEVVLQAERARRIDTVLRDLSAPHRAILQERFNNDLSYAEIAAVLNLKLGTVMSRLSRARTALQELIDKSITAEL